ncbi:hypothetical protein Tco_1581702 [Tanacetum coccineum]
MALTITWKSFATIDSNGDENTKFFHGILNSKLSQLAIRGTLVDGKLSLEQQAGLEQNVYNEEIKSAVWDCGTNKSPGHVGFTFDIVVVVKEFLLHVQDVILLLLL